MAFILADRPVAIIKETHTQAIVFYGGIHVQEIQSVTVCINN